MLDEISIENVLFLDIETVSQFANYKDLPERFKKLWDKKSEKLARNESELNPETLYEKAGIYAEFGKIICISVGFVNITKNGEHQARIKSFYGDDEKEVLIEFADLLNKHFNRSNVRLCAHNGKEFDFPYLSRRMLINKIKLPTILDMAGKKPWEILHLDTLELWKFGDYKNYTSLDLLACIFDIPTPKDDIDGSQVRAVYYEENDLERIVEYCQKDVLTIIQLYLSYCLEDLIKEEHVTYL
jgi:3'-5' exonuclease